MLQEVADNTDQVGVAAMFRISIQEVLISNLCRDTPTILVGLHTSPQADAGAVP
jgi:hypothetical protein